MATTILFVGGPIDAETRDVDIDLDIVEYREKDKVQLLVRTTVPPRHMREDRHFYRRSLRTATTYVYQP